jgi:hypothetical protein
MELGSRREVGIIFRDKKIVARLAKTFRDDWDAIERAGQQPQLGQEDEAVRQDIADAARVAKKVAKAITRDMPPVAPVLRVVVKELAGEAVDMDLDAAVVEESIKEAVKEAVRDAVETVVEQNGAANH